MAVSKKERPQVTAAQPQKKQTARRVERIKKDEVPPKFGTLFVPDSDDTIDLGDYPDTSAEENATFELSEALRRIKAEKQARREQYRVLTDPNFYLVVCFQSVFQRDEFITKARWTELGYPYVDGLKLARLLGVDIAPINLPRKQVKPTPKALRASLANKS